MQSHSAGGMQVVAQLGTAQTCACPPPWLFQAAAHPRPRNSPGSPSSRRWPSSFCQRSPRGRSSYTGLPRRGGDRPPRRGDGERRRLYGSGLRLRRLYGSGLRRRGLGERRRGLRLRAILRGAAREMGGRHLSSSGGGGGGRSGAAAAGSAQPSSCFAYDAARFAAAGEPERVQAAPFSGQDSAGGPGRLLGECIICLCACLPLLTCPAPAQTLREALAAPSCSQAVFQRL